MFQVGKPNPLRVVEAGFTIKSAHYILTPPRRRYLGHSIGKPFGATVASRGK